MNEINPEAPVSWITIPSEHGPVHGRLELVTGSKGIIVLAHAAQALDERDEIMAGIFRHAGFSTLNVDLVSAQEEHFPDVHNNIPLLAKRLVEFLGNIKHRMQFDEIPAQPFGLCAANDTSPVAVRVAALRDHDIAAVVCRGGLIDLAGILYLRSLESPVLLLVEETDATHIASSRRAMQQVTCTSELMLIPEIGFDAVASAGFESAARESVNWFKKHFQMS